MYRAQASWAQLFAGEFALSRAAFAPVQEGVAAVLTPTGLALGGLVIVGVLLEKLDGRRGLVGARVADATGAFEVVLSDREGAVREELDPLTPPLFVALSGRARLFRGGERGRPVVIPSRVCAVERSVRDSWVLRTAELTIGRIEALRDALLHGNGAPAVMEAIRQYHSSPAVLGELAAMVRHALDQVGNASGPRVATGRQPKETLLELLHGAGGREAIPVREVLARAQGLGLSREEAGKALMELLEEGECYAPRDGYIKPL
ncbi:MAG: hypothetical protein QHG99_03355 [Methanomicrobiales archaeon]|nr:hypothetical protein [Methanomicrobiales archaeon]